MPSNKAVFLDRDNTLIHNDGDLGDPRRVELIKGAASAVASLLGLGYKVVVVSNQGGVARGKYSEDDVDAVHRRMNELIEANSGAAVDRFYFCPFHPQGTVERYRREHPWRKPQAGMLLQAAKDMDLDLRQSWTIGDQLRDVQAGLAAGTRCILLQPEDSDDARELDPEAPVFFATSLIEAVRIVGQQRKPQEKIDAVRKAQAKQQASAAAVSESAIATDAPSADETETDVEASGDAKAMAATAVIEEEVETEAPPPPEPIIVKKRVTRKRKSKRDQSSSSSEAPAAPPPQAPAPKPKEEVEKPAAVEAAEVVAEIDEHPEPVTTERVTEPIVAAAPVVVEAAQKEEESPTAVTPAQAVATVSIRAPADVADEAKDESGTSDAAAAKDRSASIDRTLRQILQELRAQRGAGNDFSFIQLLAIVLQLLAAVCLAAALLMPGEGVFVRWISVAILTQLATLAMLLFRR